MKKLTQIKIKNDFHKNKAELLDQYMTLIDNEYINIKKRNNYNHIKRCEKCDTEKILLVVDSVLVCYKCGEVEPIIVDSEKPNYKDAITDSKPGYPYKRINHYNEWLNWMAIKVYVKSIC